MFVTEILTVSVISAVMLYARSSIKKKCKEYISKGGF